MRATDELSIGATPADDRARRLFAALSATNEAILKSRSCSELYRKVCDAVVLISGFKGATIALPEEDGSCLRYACAMDRDRGAWDLSQAPDIPIGPGNEHLRGFIGEAFETGLPVFSNDYANDARLAHPRLSVVRCIGVANGIKSTASIPVVRDGKSVAVIAFYLQERDAIDDDMLELMRRIAENVAFAVGNFTRDVARQRIGRMFAALSALNEAIMRAQDRDQLFSMIADAVESSGNFSSVVIATRRPGDDLLKIECAVGPAAKEMALMGFSTSSDDPRGQGLMGTAFRTRQIAASNDYLANPQFSIFHPTMAITGQRAGVAVPLTCRGESVGALLLMSGHLNSFSSEYLDLIDRFGRNISFALDNFAAAEERRVADERIQYLATHDEMTGLPNRATFSHMLNASIRASARHNRQFAVLFIDLDRFKLINDTLGHAAGDALLIETGRRITSCLRAEDIVARLGGDEFVVILSEIASQDDVAKVTRSLMLAIGTPMNLSGHECRVTASIGIAMYPDHGTDEQTLTRRADMAMYGAKQDGKDTFSVFNNQEIQAQSVERLEMEASLRHALERDEFRVHYQPKLDLATGQVCGVEALIRWQHPALGMVSPDRFISLAEETGLIIPIGRWVLREACRQYMAWQASGVGPVRMAVNLSPRQFSHASLLSDIDAALAESGMPSSMLQLEVTESMMMRNVERAIVLLDAIRARGCWLAIDDFGTGYSCMSLLKRLPVHCLKIDRSFVSGLPTDQEDAAITQAIISMAKALSLTVVAEGVETAEQKAFLDRQACDEMQGYLFSKPLPADELAALLLSLPAPAPLSPFVGMTDRRRIGERRRSAAGQMIVVEP